MLTPMKPSDWIALCAVLSGLLTSVAALWMNSRVTRRAAQQQVELLNRQLNSEAIRASDQRLWTARADVYADYLGWLRGNLRETLKYRLADVVSGEIQASWWKTPYDLGNRMRLFESDTVHNQRATLVQELAAIGEVASLLRAGPVTSGRSEVFQRLQAAASDAVRIIDDLADGIRQDMQAGPTSAHSQLIDFVEDLADLDDIADSTAVNAAQELLESLRVTES
ncbi:hypothetical protein [Phycicoccus sp. SLBN-51]|uniref:hypothetical protein n=1 Tax=Phycicoccus sp. SLBN-51 TaxID=2768447 RepID=UPI00135A03D2|nr:hypothetical protein [Phycicoccus sp. SLBN-51]